MKIISSKDVTSHFRIIILSFNSSLAFGVIFPIIISPLLIYWVYKKLNELRERRKVQSVFLIFKEYLKSTLPEYKDNIGFQWSFRDSSYFMTQIENLAKIGISVPTTESGNILFIILGKYLFTGLDLRNLTKGKKEYIDANIDNYERVLNEIIEYSKDPFNIKLDTKLVKLK